MIYKKVIITLTVVLSMSLTFSALGQSGTWYIAPGAPSYVTPGYMDSLHITPHDGLRPSHNFGLDSIGKYIFISDAFIQKDSTKLKCTFYVCGEKYWVRGEGQADTVSDIVDYKTYTTSLDSTGNELWTESISVSVIDSSEIVINSPVDVKAKIYEAYDIVNPVFTELTVNGTGLDQYFSVHLESGKLYIIAFFQNGNSLVYAKRIGVQ